MRFAIIGPAQSGKTTFAGYLAKVLDTNHTDLSGWIVEVETIRLRRIEEIKADALGNPTSRGGAFFELSPDWDPVRNRPKRENLIALGDAVCELRPSFLIERAFERAPIIAGVRRIEEFETLPDDVVTVYITRNDIPDIKDTFDIPMAVVDVIIDNNGTLEELEQRANQLVERYA